MILMIVRSPTVGARMPSLGLIPAYRAALLAES
jgi:hypothetical protein